MGQQIKIYFQKWMRLFWTTKGWKVFIFGGIISGLITMVVGNGMFSQMKATNNGAFTLVSACIWIGIFNSIQEICKERDIIKREHRSGMKISAYILARALYEAVICLGQALIILIICAAKFDIPSDGPMFGNGYVDLFIAFFFILLSSDFLGLAISSIVKTTTTAMTTMPFVLIIQLIFADVLFELSGTAKSIANITIGKWGMKCVGSIGGLENMYKMAGKADKAKEYADAAAGEGILMVILFCAIYIGIAIVALSFVDRDKR